MRHYRVENARLSTFLSVIESEPESTRFVFRGQSRAEWKLKPHLYRIDAPHTRMRAKDIIGGLEAWYDEREERCIDRFFGEGLPYLPNIDQTYSNKRILAQHFGVPTRLLDWSRDPLVAAFFAVEDWHSSYDAAIYMLIPDANFAMENSRSLEGYSAIKLIPPAIDRRIIAQKSVFTHHPYGKIDESFIPLDDRPSIGAMTPTRTSDYVRGFAKITIPGDMKGVLLYQLLRMGVDRRSLFPGLDGVGVDILMRNEIGGFE